MVSEVYKKLYHYTTWDGLLEILQTQTLWATHYKFLNDYSEFALMRDKLIEYLSPIVQEKYRKLIKQGNDVQRVIDRKGGLDRVVLHDTVVTVDAAYRATGEEFYIVSFCGEDKNSYVNSNGRLSQWRGYGVGGGIALVFDTHKLEEKLKIEAERYSYGTGHISEEGSTLKPEKERKFRTKNGKLIPYIELFNSTDIVLPIERIIVGPHKEKESRASALCVMLRNTNTEITISDIPYVA